MGEVVVVDLEIDEDVARRLDEMAVSYEISTDNLSDPVETEKLAEAERDVSNGNFVSFEELFGDDV